MPETPVWLLSRGKEKEALKSLCYLRGWTVPDHVREEFDQLAEYTKKLQYCIICYKTGGNEQDCKHGQMNCFTRFGNRLNTSGKVSVCAEPAWVDPLFKYFSCEAPLLYFGLKGK